MVHKREEAKLNRPTALTYLNPSVHRKTMPRRAASLTFSQRSNF